MSDDEFPVANNLRWDLWYSSGFSLLVNPFFRALGPDVNSILNFERLTKEFYDG